MKIEFDTENAAFREYHTGDPDALIHEVARILRCTANKIINGDTYGLVRDINGNSIGSWSLN